MRTSEIKKKMITVLKDNGLSLDMSDFDLPLDFDSLKYMQLLISLEEEFEYTFDEAELIRIETINDIFILIKEKSYERK